MWKRSTRATDALSSLEMGKARDVIGLEHTRQRDCQEFLVLDAQETNGREETRPPPPPSSSSPFAHTLARYRRVSWQGWVRGENTGQEGDERHRASILGCLRQ